MATTLLLLTAHDTSKGPALYNTTIDSVDKMFRTYSYMCTLNRSVLGMSPIGA